MSFFISRVEDREQYNDSDDESPLLLLIAKVNTISMFQAYPLELRSFKYKCVQVRSFQFMLWALINVAQNHMRHNVLFFKSFLRIPKLKKLKFSKGSNKCQKSKSSDFSKKIIVSNRKSFQK